jgi:tetraacyldisaccharide 4'-kinase
MPAAFKHGTSSEPKFRPCAPPTTSFSTLKPTDTSKLWAHHLEEAWLTRGALACVLLPLTALYAGVTVLRHVFYRLGWLKTDSVQVPVIVVGNLITGGAGKTPTVIAIVQALRRHGWHPGIISRGYGASVDKALHVTSTTPVTQCGDEPLLMHLRTGNPVVVARRRAEAAKQLLRLHPTVNVLVSDDGLQHLALKRDVQVIVFDERGVGNGWLLPAGPLRESLPSNTPARSLVLYNSAAPSTRLPGTLVQRSIQGTVSLTDWWDGKKATHAALHKLRKQSLVASAGLANPERFFKMLRDQGLNITPLALPDHHSYATLPWHPNTAQVIVTEKDAIKLNPARADIGNTVVWVAPLDFVLPFTFETELIALLTPHGITHGNTSA